MLIILLPNTLPSVCCSRGMLCSLFESTTSVTVCYIVSDAGKLQRSMHINGGRHLIDLMKEMANDNATTKLHTSTPYYWIQAAKV